MSSSLTFPSICAFQLLPDTCRELAVPALVLANIPI